MRGLCRKAGRRASAQQRTTSRKIGYRGARVNGLIEKFRTESVERVQGVGNMIAHQPFRFLGAAGDNGVGNAFVIVVRGVDAAGIVKSRKQQTIDGNSQAFDEGGDVLITRTFDDQPMPLVVETRKLFVIARMLELIEIFLQLFEPLFDRERGVVRAIRRGQSFERHARAIEMHDFIARQMFDRRAFEFFDRDHAFRRQSLQCFAHATATRVQFAHDVGFDESLAGNESTGANAIAYPCNHIADTDSFARRNRGLFQRFGNRRTLLGHIITIMMAWMRQSIMITPVNFQPRRA